MLESLESRVLLSGSSWVGTWAINGYQNDFDTSNIYSASHTTLRVTGKITALNNGDYNLCMLMGSHTKNLELQLVDGELQGHFAGLTSNSDGTGSYPHDAYMRLIPLDNNAALFLFGDEGSYSDSNPVNLEWSSGGSGLMTRGNVAVTNRPFAGSYDVAGYTVGVSQTNSTYWPTIITAETGQVTVTDGGAGAYSAVWPGSSDVIHYQLSGKGLCTADCLTDPVGSEVHYTVINQGPDDTLYVMDAAGYFSSYDRYELTNGTFSVAVLHPRAGSKYVADLTGSITSTKLPTAATSGDGTIITVPIVVTNSGIAPVAKGAKMNVAIYARPEGGDGSTDVSIGELKGQSVASLAKGKSKTLSAKVTLPIGLESGNYTLVAKLDTGGAIKESDATNNDAVSTGVIAVTEGRPDLQATLGTVKMNEVVLNDVAIKGSVQVTITNVGNVATPAGQKVNVTVLARDGDGHDTVLGTVVNCPAVLKKNGKKTVTVPVSLVAGLETGTYTLVAEVEPTTSLNEWLTTNNSAAWANAIYAGPATADLVGSKLSYKAGTYSAGKAMTVKFYLKNQGTGATGPFDVYAYLSTDQVLDGGDFLLGWGEEDTGLAAGAGYAAPMTRPSLPSLPTGSHYYVIVVIDVNDDVTEANELNDTLVSATANVVIA